MFDIGTGELLLILVVAVLVIRPKDLPLAARTLGRWIGKARRMRATFTAGIDNFVQQSEIGDLESDWDRRRATILKDLTEREGTSSNSALPNSDAPADQGTIQSPSAETPPSAPESSLTT